MGDNRMKDTRVLVVGGSAGIGRAIGISAAQRGAKVVFSGRRLDRLEEAVQLAGSGHAIACDVQSTDQCRNLIEETLRALGGLDLIVYTTGVSPLRRIRHVEDADWESVLSTNAVGAHRILAAAHGYLSPNAVVCVMSTETVGAPRVGLGHYAASKAALEDVARAWRLEHPELRITTMAVGATFPTEFGNSFDPTLLGEIFQEWIEHGEVRSTMMDVDDVGRLAVDLFTTMVAHPGISIDHLLLQPASPRVAEAEPGAGG